MSRVVSVHQGQNVKLPGPGESGPGVSICKCPQASYTGQSTGVGKGCPARILHSLEGVRQMNSQSSPGKTVQSQHIFALLQGGFWLKFKSLGWGPPFARCCPQGGEIKGLFLGTP